MTDEEKEMRAEGEAIRDLVRHPGWGMLMRRIDERAQASLAAMRGAKSEFEVMTHHARYVALTDLHEYARSTARLLLTVGAQ